METENAGGRRPGLPNRPVGVQVHTVVRNYVYVQVTQNFQSIRSAARHSIAPSQLELDIEQRSQRKPNSANSVRSECESYFHSKTRHRYGSRDRVNEPFLSRE